MTHLGGGILSVTASWSVTTVSHRVGKHEPVYLLLKSNPECSLSLFFWLMLFAPEAIKCDTIVGEN